MSNLDSYRRLFQAWFLRWLASCLTNAKAWKSWTKSDNLGQYNEKKVEKGLAELMYFENIQLLPETMTPERLHDYMDVYSSQNTRIKNAQFHVAVSCKGNEYSHAQLLEIAKMYLKEMGYSEEGQPLLVYAHHDTPNNHIHIITSRVAPDGRKINKDFEKKRSREATIKIMEQYTGQRQEPILNEVAAQALVYRYTSKARFVAILNRMGYECKDDDEKPTLHIYKGGDEVGTIQVQLIMQHALKDNKPEDHRRRQLRAILKKYRDLSVQKFRSNFTITIVLLWACLLLHNNTPV